MTGGAATLCIILDAGLLRAGNTTVNPDAMSLIGTAVRLDAELALSPLGQRVEIVLEDDGSSVVTAVHAIADRDFVTVDTLGAVAKVCTPDAAQIILALEPHAIAEGIVWVLGDELYGLGDIDDADRRFREVLGVPVPRPLPPDMVTGELIRFPAATAWSTLMRATFEVNHTSWTILDGQAVLYSEASDQIDSLLAFPGATRVSHAVHLTRLRLVDSVPQGATPLLRLEGMTLVEAVSDTTEGTPWREMRFATLR